MSDRKPKISQVRVMRRDPIVEQAVRWSWGPGLGDDTTVNVRRTGNTVNLSGWRSADFPTLDLEQARLLRDALTNVIEWKDQDDDE